MFEGFAIVMRCLDELYPGHTIHHIALRPQSDVVNCGLWAEWVTNLWSRCTDEEAYEFEKHLLVQAKAVGVSDLGDKPCEMGDTQADENRITWGVGDNM